MASRWIWVPVCALLVNLLAGCAGDAPLRPQLAVQVTEPDLLDGRPYGLGRDDRATGADLVAVSDEMRAFLAEKLRPGLSDEQKMWRILDAIQAAGLQVRYDNFKTFTAREAFYAGEGNCMSFTNLFVALAREAGLDVHYQEVEVPATWAARDELWFDNRHINAVVNLPRKQYVVDFNMVAFDLGYRSWALDDDAALARYYNNMGVHWMSQGMEAESFLSFREAIRLQPDVGYFWTNLGTLYRRGGHDALAEAAYLRAIEQTRDPAAMSNLARLYAQAGEPELAEQYAEKVRLFRSRNPYYLYYLAEQAYAEAAYGEAEQLLNRAIDRNDQEHAFYRLLGFVHLGQGRVSRAREDFLRAVEVADDAEMAPYNRKLELLAAAADRAG